MNQIYEQLMLFDSSDGREIELTATSGQLEFLDLHKQIMYCGTAASSYMIQCAKAIKRMKDDKLYLSAGFETFGDYAENAIGIKERQAYNYISLAEKYTDEFLQLNASLGITKLALLANVSDEERDALIDNGAADATTKELQERIRELEAEKADAHAQYAFDLGELESKLENVSDNQSADLDYALAEKDRLSLELARLQSEADEKIKAAITQANEAAKEKEQKKLDKLTADKSKIEKELQELKSAPPTVEKVDNPETVARVTELERRLAESEAEQVALEKKLKIEADPNLSKFKFLFEKWKTGTAEIVAQLDLLDDGVRDNMRLALKRVWEAYYEQD